MKTPMVISKSEWQEIIQLPQVIDAWELEDNDTVESFTENIFAVKFNYTDDPSNNLYIISSGEPDAQNIMIKRMNGNLFVQD